MFRGPAARLPEWIEYHRMMGAEHFYIYDNIWERYLALFFLWVDEALMI